MSTVSTYDPTTKPAVILTPAAIAHFKKEIQKHQAIGLRLGVKKAGCSGLKYIVDYVKSADEPGQIFAIENDLQVYIEPESLLPLFGITIDYVREGLNGRIKFTNPNEKNSCGCGESFSV